MLALTAGTILLKDFLWLLAAALKLLRAAANNIIQTVLTALPFLVYPKML
jgi:hypothetical protein